MAATLKAAAVENLAEIIRRIDEEQVNGSCGEEWRDADEIAMDRPAGQVFGRERERDLTEAGAIGSTFFVAQGDRLIPRRSFTVQGSRSSNWQGARESAPPYFHR